MVIKNKKIKSKKKLCFERCDKLWREIIYLRAKGKSEISGAPTDKNNRNAHHVWGKKTNTLRFDIRNGINLTVYEHIYQAHSSDPSVSIPFQNRIEYYIKQREGEKIYEMFQIEKNQTGSDIFMIEIYLNEELKKLQRKEDEKNSS
jgi:hypothetical protein